MKDEQILDMKVLQYKILQYILLSFIYEEEDTMVTIPLPFHCTLNSIAIE